jgi:hypothetical protein
MDQTLTFIDTLGNASTHTIHLTAPSGINDQNPFDMLDDFGSVTVKWNGTKWFAI